MVRFLLTVAKRHAWNVEGDTTVRLVPAALVSSGQIRLGSLGGKGPWSVRFYEGIILSH